MEFERVPAIAKYLSLVFFLGWIGGYTVWNFLPIFFERHIESIFLIGVLTSLPSIVTILLDIPTGNLVQRAGEKIIIFLGLLVAVFPPLLYISAAPVFLVLGKMAEGVSKSFVWNGGWSINLKSADEDVESESISIFLLGINLARVVGPVLGGYIIASYGFNLPFKLWAFTAALAVMVFYSYIGLEGKRGFLDSLEDLFHKKTYFDDWHHIRDNWKNLSLPLVLVFLYSVIFSFYWLAVPLLLKDVGADFMLMGAVFGLAAVPKVFQFVFGDLADRVGQMRLVVMLTVLLTPVLILMGSFQQKVFIAGLFLVARFLTSGLSPAIHAFFDSRVPDEVEGEMVGFLELFKHSGSALGPIVAGTVASLWSVNGSFIAAAGVSALIFLVASHHRFA
ncbi:MAG: MFS transporter [Candidatus Nanohaloarchaea archaeon]